MSSQERRKACEMLRTTLRVYLAEQTSQTPLALALRGIALEALGATEEQLAEMIPDLQDFTRAITAARRDRFTPFGMDPTP